MIYQLSKIITFEASHRLEHHDGKCARLHGHSWVAEIFIESNDLIDSGHKKNMVMDYSDIKKSIKPLVENYLDHHHLNDTLATDSPTSEYVAKWIYEKLKPELPQLSSVGVKETCTSSCLYRPLVKLV